MLLKPPPLEFFLLQSGEGAAGGVLDPGGEGLFGDRAAYSATPFTMPVSGVNDTRVRLVWEVNSKPAVYSMA